MPEHVKDAVVAFFQNDEYSRLCPGKKDYVTVKIDGQKVHQQKRLLLCNLRELYVNFVFASDHRIGFSKFCQLRPKWCKSVGSTGMHNVCVCQHHQNVKLAVNVLPENQEYKLLLSKITCSVENRNCMLKQCVNCPGKEALIEYLHGIYEESELDTEDMGTH